MNDERADQDDAVIALRTQMNDISKVPLTERVSYFERAGETFEISFICVRNAMTASS